jgi:hypothetical protein
VEDVGGVVHAGLERAVAVGVAGGGRAEAHIPAEVVAPAVAESAGAATDARLDGDALADLEICDLVGDGGDDAGGLMAEDERGADGEVAVAAMRVVMHCGASAKECGARRKTYGRFRRGRWRRLLAVHSRVRGPRWGGRVGRGCRWARRGRRRWWWMGKGAWC